MAETMEAAYLTALAKGEVGIVDRAQVPGFEKAMREFLAWSAREHAAKPRTHQRYEVSSKPLLRHFPKDRPIDQITVEEIERYEQRRAVEPRQSRAKKRTKRPRGERRAWQPKRLLRPATINRELACLKAMFNYWIKADVIYKNPVSRVSFLAEDNEQTRVVSLEEERLYLAAANVTHADVAGLLIETGLRPEEVYRAMVEHVHMNAREPEKSHLFNPHGKTKAARRRVPLNAKAREIIARRLKVAREKGSPFLFPHRDDPQRRMVKSADAHRAALEASGVRPFTLYVLRHTWATRQVEAGPIR